MDLKLLRAFVTVAEHGTVSKAAELLHITQPALSRQLRGLEHQVGFPLFERLKKESMLQPEDLLRVGRHFNGSIGPEQRFGGEVLHYVAKKHAKAKVGEEARMMIRAEGLA